MTSAEVGTRVVAPPLRALLPRALRRQPGRRRLQPRLFGDVATEMCILTDGDEGLFASYSDVQFQAPVRAGDVLEITCEITRVGTPVARPRASPCTSWRAAPRPPSGPGAAGSWPSRPGHHGDRHRRRPGLTGRLNRDFGVSSATRRPEAKIFRADWVLGTPSLTCGFARFRRSGRC